MRDNVVVITGASRGIGAELARQLAVEGAKLALATRRRCRELVMTPQGKLLQWLKLIAPGLVDRMARRAIERVR